MIGCRLAVGDIGAMGARAVALTHGNPDAFLSGAVLTHMLAQVSGLEVGEFVHVIADCHIYDRHIPMVEEMLEKKPFDAPKFILDPNVKDFYDFTMNDVIVENYQHGPQVENIPIAV